VTQDRYGSYWRGIIRDGARFSIGLALAAVLALGLLVACIPDQLRVERDADRAVVATLQAKVTEGEKTHAADLDAMKADLKAAQDKLAATDAKVVESKQQQVDFWTGAVQSGTKAADPFAAFFPFLAPILGLISGGAGLVKAQFGTKKEVA